MGSIPLLIAWVVIGVALGVWRTNDFLSRLNAKFPTLPPTRFGGVEGLMVVLWVLGWPALILVDEISTRRVLNRD